MRFEARVPVEDAFEPRDETALRDDPRGMVVQAPKKPQAVAADD